MSIYLKVYKKYQNRFRQYFSTRLIPWYKIMAIIQRMTMDMRTMSSWKRRVAKLIEIWMRKEAGAVRNCGKIKAWKTNGLDK
ncbi:MAG: hypothetical protein HFJ10_12900 [Lachnospiraceae bacterium]|jgi:hypothetical protein|nr:hypothetical protein [Lachnospiraceae bacterium]